MRNDDLAYYESLVSTWFSDLTCLTWSEGVGLEDVASAFGAEPAVAEHMSLEDAQIEQYNADIPGILPLLVTGTIGTWTLVIEPNGSEGARPEVLKALSAHGRAVSVLLNSGQGDRLSYAASGRLVSVRMTPSPHASPNRLPRNADAVIDSVATGDGTELQAATLLAAERITGERLTGDWLLSDGHARLLIEDPLPDDIVPEEYRDHHVLDHPEIRAIIDDLSPDKFNRIRYVMVRAVVQGSHLPYPTVDQALELLRGDHDEAPRWELRRRVVSLRDDLAREAGSEQEPRLRALDVLLDGLGDDLAESVHSVADHAYMGHLADDQKAIIVLMKRCLRHIARSAS